MADITSSLFDSIRSNRVATQFILDVKNKLNILNTVTTDISGDGWESKGNTIQISQPTTFTAVNTVGSEDTSVTWQGGADSVVTMTLAYNAMVAYRYTDLTQIFAVNKSGPEALMANAATAIAKYFETQFLNQYANAGYVVGAFGTAVSIDTMTSAAEKFATYEAPEENRHMILHPNEYYKLFGTGTTANPALTSDDYTVKGPMVSGKLNQSVGIMPHYSTRCPVAYAGAYGATQEHYGLSYQKDGIAVAVRPLPIEQGGGVEQFNITHPDGLTIRVSFTRDMSLNSTASCLKFEMLFGIQVLRSSWVYAVHH